MNYNKYHLASDGCFRANGQWAMTLSLKEFRNTLASQRCKACEKIAKQEKEDEQWVS